MLTAVGYSDSQLAFDIVQGVPNFGDIPRTGSHAPCEVPATREHLEAGYAARLRPVLHHTAKKARRNKNNGGPRE